VNDRPRIFLTKRLIRIVPLYWAATLALVVKNLVLSEKFDASVGDILLSLFFVPHYSDGSGELFPYLVPGWTLNFEMFFYLVFGIGLAARRPVAFTALAIGTLTAVGLVVDPRQAAAFTYTHPLMLEFLAGVLLAVVSRRGHLRLWHGALALPGVIGLFALPAAPGWAEMPGRLIASTFVVGGVLAVNELIPVSRLGVLLGDASYSVYLTHTVVSLTVAELVFARLPLSGPVAFIVWLVLAILVSSVVGVLSYWWVEKPTLRALRPRLLRPTPVKVAPARTARPLDEVQPNEG
jgi:exopolysaccharide production protein ExoZ